MVDIIYDTNMLMGEDSDIPSDNSPIQVTPECFSELTRMKRNYKMRATAAERAGANDVSQVNDELFKRVTKISVNPQTRMVVAQLANESNEVSMGYSGDRKEGLSPEDRLAIGYAVVLSIIKGTRVELKTKDKLAAYTAGRMLDKYVGSGREVA